MFVGSDFVIKKQIIEFSHDKPSLNVHVRRKLIKLNENCRWFFVWMTTNSNSKDSVVEVRFLLFFNKKKVRTVWHLKSMIYCTLFVNTSRSCHVSPCFCVLGSNLFSIRVNEWFHLSVIFKNFYERVRFSVKPSLCRLTRWDPKIAQATLASFFLIFWHVWCSTYLTFVILIISQF